MKQIFSVILALCAVSLLYTSCIAQDSADGSAPDDASPEPLSTLRQGLEAYTQAFNAGDAEALANFWAAEGELITADGTLFRGHQALRDCFARYFAEAKAAKLELIAPQIELLSPHVARERGTARVITAEQEPSDTDYEAIYVKAETGWKLDSVREYEVTAAPPSHYEQLQPLEWMVGTWVDDAEDAQIETTCRWTTNQNFLVRSFKVFIQDRIDFEGTQVIGWDASTEQIRSWMFDSDGGFSTGVWNGTDDGWTVHTLSVLPDGRRASSTNIYVLVDENTVEFQSIGRQIDNELLPNIDPLRVIRLEAQPVAVSE